MATNFPAGSDNFSEPNSPGSTALSASGTGSRNHVQHHRDAGDAIQAMQAEATLLVHSHDGSTARHGSKLAQANTHESADTDSSTTALHHTLGSGANQIAPANHNDLEPWVSTTHSAPDYRPIGSIFMSVVSTNPSSFFGGTWVAIEDRFLIGAGGSFVVSATGGASTHAHTNSAIQTVVGHTHTMSNTGSYDDTAGGSESGHKHSNSSTGSTNPSHTHSTSTHSGTANAQDASSTPAIRLSSGHTHSLPSGGVSHSHTMADTNATDFSHSHTTSATGSAGGHTHTVSSTGSTSNLPPYLSVYMWRRTA